MSAKPETTLELLRQAIDIAVRDRHPEDLRELVAKWLPRGRDAVNEILGNPTSERSFADLADFIETWMTEDAAARLARRISWPIAGLNNITNGIPRSVMTTIAARTSVGKSALGLDCVVDHAAREKGDVLVLSHELPYELVAKRLAARLTGVPRWKVEDGVLSAEEKHRMRDATARLRAFRGSVNDSCRDVDTAADWIVERSRKKPIDLVVVDYLQLVANNSSTRRHEQIADATGRLIDAARETNAALLSLAQINRAGADAPQLHHLRDSGSIEQDSRIVVILDRPAARQVPDALQCEAQAWVAKNGEGPVGKLKLHFNPFTQRFTDTPCDCVGVTPPLRVVSDRRPDWWDR